MLARRIRVALGEEPGDLLLQGGSIVNVFMQQTEPANVVICDGWIAGVGPWDWEAERVLDISGSMVIPGLFDAHMHLESSLLLPGELAKAVVPHGTSTIIADPHEVANVLGVDGIDLLLSLSENLPLDIYFMAPSCVPATEWEHAGAVIDADAIAALLQKERVIGLAEVMDFPAVLDAQPSVLEKINAAAGLGAPLDGHAPGLMGRRLLAYAAAGIRSDHESSTAQEALQKAALGMMVQVREGSSAKNLQALLPLMRENLLADWCLATDDIHPNELLAKGHLDAILRRVISAGIPPAQAIRHATLVPARHYGLHDRGAVTASYRAHLCVIDNFEDFTPEYVIHNGRIVAENGRYSLADEAKPVLAANTIRCAKLHEEDFQLSLADGPAPVIGVTDGLITTQSLALEVSRDGNHWAFDPQADIALIAVIERHRATGQIGLALVHGLGLTKTGAIGSSVAHDSHNLIIAGTNPGDMRCCADQLQQMGGGFVAVAERTVQAKLALPVAGLLSTASAEEVRSALAEVNWAAGRLGCPLLNPFGTLSFLGLPVIPELRITDQGLFDVLHQRFLSYA